MDRLFSQDRHQRLWLAGGAVLLFILLLRSAWCAEDAYIGFRVVDNFLQGNGLVWNVGERVQVFTDPLFEFLVIIGAAILRSDYWSSMAVSLILSLLAYFFLMRGRAVLPIVLGTVVLVSAKGFIDFSVSGLENPCTHLAIAAYVWVYWRKRDPFWLTFIASLSAANRMDSLLLFLPSLLWVYYHEGRRFFKPALAGAGPFLAWEAFSIFYYGFPFPNTAYAKLNTGIAAGQLVMQGIHYLQTSIAWDTVAILTVAGGVALGLLRNDWPLALGVIFSVCYVVRIGGDYMVGRFLTPAFVLSLALLIQHAPKRRLETLAIAAAALIFGLLIPSPTLLTTRDFGKGLAPEYFGISDERMKWYSATGLMRGSSNPSWPDHVWRQMGQEARAKDPRVLDLMPVGMIPYYAGPRIYVYDRGALADSLTARLPMRPGPWMPGHFWREPPAGYVETLQTGVNQIKDKNLAEYYDHLRRIIRGNLWEPSRWRDIIAMNLGMYNHLL